MDADRFKAAMRRTASGVAVVTTDGNAGRAGLTVSSLCSLSMEPPSVVFCVHRASGALERLLANGIFAANILAHGQAHVADAFAGLVPELRHDRFAAATWGRLESTAPVLDGALCSFDCRIAGVFDFGTHHIVAGEVVALSTAADAAPLIFSDHAYRRLAAA